MRAWAILGAIALALGLPTVLGLWSFRTAMPIDDGVHLLLGTLLISLLLGVGWLRAMARKDERAILWILGALFLPLPLLAGATWVNVAFDGPPRPVRTSILRVERVNPPGEGADEYYAMLEPWDAVDVEPVAVPISARVFAALDGTSPLPVDIAVGSGALGVRWVAVEDGTVPFATTRADSR